MPVACAVLALAGCGSTPQRADTSSGAATPPSASSPSAADAPAASESAPASSDSDPAKVSGDALSQAEARAALLTVQEMPTGWSKDANSKESDTDTKVSPASCQKEFDAMDAKAGDDKPASKARVTFTQGGMAGPTLEMSVESYAKERRDDWAKDATKLLTKCSHLTLTDPDGTRASVDFVPMSFPNLGERTVALRMKVKTQGIEAVADLVAVATGHTMTSFATAGLQPVPGTTLEKIARSGMAKLAAASQN